MPRPLPFTRTEIVDAPAVLFFQPRKVRFQEVDAAGTVFFPRIIEYFADTYIAMLDARGVDVARSLKKLEWAIPLAHVEADFLGPMRFGDHVVVEVVGARLAESSFTLAHRVRSPDATKTLAYGQTVHVVVDGTSFRPTPIPEAIKLALASEAP
jgi:1,4-dihydroxy-2-naphthoyl-CoA hydrolase